MSRERRLPLRYSADEEQLRKVVRSFLADVVPAPSGDRATWADLDPSGTTWRRLTTELGLPGIAVDEAHGGQGFGVAALAIVFHELGRVTCAAPLFGSMALAARVLHHLPRSAERDRVLAGLAEGSLRATWLDADDGVHADGDALDGDLPAVVDADTADVLVVSSGASMWAVPSDADGVTITPMTGLDPTRTLSRVRLDSAAGTALAGDARAAVERARAEACVVLAAELAGVAEAALDEAVGYARIREQFGRPIGSFQSLKHRMADALVGNEGAWSTTRHAALLADVLEPGTADEELALAAGVAKSASASAALFSTAENIQIHGGIGFTWEHAAHLRFRRARSGGELLGSVGTHRARTAALLLGTKD